MSAHTVEQDFDHFMSYTNLGIKASFTREDMLRAYGANWVPAGLPAVQAEVPIEDCRRYCQLAADNWPKDFRDVIAGAEKVAYELGRAAGLKDAEKICEQIEEQEAAANYFKPSEMSLSSEYGAEKCGSAIRALNKQEPTA